MKNTIKSICVIIGTIVGAGFASGKEIFIFFNSYGIYGIFGLAISSILIGLIIYKILNKIKQNEVKNYKEYLLKLNCNKYIKDIFTIIINIFLCISFYIMIAGFCAYFYQEYKIPQILIGIIICTICYFNFMNHIDGITKINIIIIPFLIIMILLLGIKFNVGNIVVNQIYKINIFNNQNNIINNFNIKWLLSSLEYASYNSILLIPMLIELKKYTYGKEKIISLITSIIFFTLGIIIYLVLTYGGINLINVELPIIYIVKQFGNIYKYIYSLVIISAIYTTAISAGFSFLENCSKNEKIYKNICLLLCITAPFVSNLGFSNLVNITYPVFGILGIVYVIIFI